jgi:hypothetical protein
VYVCVFVCVWVCVSAWLYSGESYDDNDAGTILHVLFVGCSLQVAVETWQIMPPKTVI